MGKGKQDMLDEKRPSASFFIGDHDSKPVKIVGPNDEEIALEEIIIPPDGGWGWVIVLASFLSNLVVDGTVFSFGILLNPIHEASGKTIPISTIAWVGSLATGFYFLAGPVISAVANRFGFRVVAICGSFMASLSVFCAWWFCREQPVMWVLFLMYGVVGGVGFGMIYVPAVIAVGFYFDNKRALATGIAICGSGIGTFIFPPIMNYLIERYGWQGALLFQSGIILSCALFGLLYRPLKPTKVIPEDMRRRKSMVSSIGSPDGTPLLQRIQKAREMEKWDSIQSITNDGLPPEGDPKIKPSDRRVRKTSAYTLGSSEGVGMVVPPKRGSVPTMLSSSAVDNSVLLVPPIPGKGKSFVGLSDLTEIAEEDHSEDHSREGSAQPTINNNLVKLPENETANKLDCSSNNTVDGNDNENAQLNNPKQRRNSTFMTKIGSSLLIVDEMTQSRILRVASRVSLTKPMYRDDIFYTGSLLRLPQYADNVNKVMTSAEWSAAVSNAPQGMIPDDEIDGSCCSPGILTKMLDVSLLKSPMFLLLAISGFFTMLGLFVPFIYLKGVATESVGLSVSVATLLVSIIGVANTAGRIVAGWIADRPEINVLFLNNASITIIGLATAAVPFLNSFHALIGFATVFGLAMACFASLRSILLVELFGLEKLTNAFGLSLLLQGFASILGSPLAGFLYEKTGNYTVPFGVAGFFIILSAVMCYPLNCVKRWEEARNKKRHENNV